MEDLLWSMLGDSVHTQMGVSNAELQPETENLAENLITGLPENNRSTSDEG